MLFLKLVSLNLLLAQTIQVQQLDPDYNTQPLASKKVQIKLANEIEKLTDQREIIPPKSEVEIALKKADLDIEVKSLDRLDRDQLYLRAKKFKLIEMIKFYPNLPKEKIENLINLLSAKDANGSKK